LATRPGPVIGLLESLLLARRLHEQGDLDADDYAERTAERIPTWHAMNGKRAGDRAKLARALVELADSDEPPLRWVAGADAVEGVEQKARLLLAQVDARRARSTGLAHDDAQVAA